MMKKDAEQWRNEARTGVFRTFGFFRGRLRSGEALSADERAGLVDLLDLCEVYVGHTWPVVEDAAGRPMTQTRKLAGILGMIVAWCLFYS